VQRPIRRILLTASGGPFRGRKREELKNIQVEDALKHPNWSMGRKITVDSATLVNKGLEMIEAKWLFDVTPKEIEVVVHPQSIIHSMVQFADGAIIAQMGEPDMRIPIQYAISLGERWELNTPRTHFPTLSQMTFFAPDLDKFPCLRLAYEAVESGGNTTCIMNAANEEKQYNRAKLKSFLSRKGKK
jgi:1-deoxy-D-xylulose-5-phosphate reductoisomerase